MGKRPIVTIGGIRTTIKACDSAKEGIEGQYDLLPFLSSPFEQLRYYYSVAKEDGWYVDRAFMFRGIRVVRR